MNEASRQQRTDDQPRTGPDQAGAPPTAQLRRERRFTFAWLVPITAVLFAAWLGYSAWQGRGVRVSVQFPEGHGLKVGDAVRFRGIAVGAVHDIAIAGNLDDIIVTLDLRAQADALARSGTRFWIVRPRVGLAELQGVETLVGPRYVAALPTADDDASVRRQRRFIGLAEPPPVESIGPGDLEIVLEAPARGSLSRGAPVTYRQVRIGTVLSVGLASDGSAVEARVHIRKPYRDLIRENTRFWDAGGVKASVGLSGLSVEMSSLIELISGGVALATPPLERAGNVVGTGARFPLACEPEDDWLEWRPAVPIGSSLLPPGAPAPRPLRATLAWKQGLIFKGQRSRHGWVIQMSDGLLGPADLLVPGEEAEKGSVTLEIAGGEVELPSQPAWRDRGLARLDTSVTARDWPRRFVRSAGQPEDCIAIADPTAAPMPLAASRLTAADGHWRIDPAVPLDASWHGASVVSRTDGYLVGMLLVDDDEARVALLQTND